MDRAELIRRTYGMEAHTEGGYFSEVYTAQAPKGGRAGMGSIYFLLDGADVSHFHQLDCDELWFFHEGCGIRLIMLLDGREEELLLGTDTEHGQRAMVLMPKGAIFAAVNLDPEGYTLVSAATSPAFNYEGFRLVLRDELQRTAPAFERKYGEYAYERMPEVQDT